MNIVTQQLPDGSWQAYDDNRFDGDPADVGRGPTEADAIADLRGVYGEPALDRKHYVALAYLRYRLRNSCRCKAAQVESMAALMRRPIVYGRPWPEAAA